MLGLRLALAVPALLLAAPVSPATPWEIDPLRFFEGRTVSQGTVKVMLRKPYKSRSIGDGTIERDGSLTLVQRIREDGRAPRERRWKVRRNGPERFTASMSEAVGPVAIDRVGERYRFRFRMKGNLKVEQMLTPLPGGRSARTRSKVRRLGIVVATTNGTIRKISG